MRQQRECVTDDDDDDMNLRRSRDGTLFGCSCVPAVRVFVNQILASVSSLWPAVTLFT